MDRTVWMLSMRVGALGTCWVIGNGRGSVGLRLMGGLYLGTPSMMER